MLIFRICTGILYSVLITAVITDAIKDGVGRPRPDFFWRCFPDGKPVKSFKCCQFSLCMLSLIDVRRLQCLNFLWSLNPVFFSRISIISPLMSSVMGKRVLSRKATRASQVAIRHVRTNIPSYAMSKMLLVAIFDKL
jgi:hypothetical protein